MSLPTLAKTWTFDVNHAQTPQGSVLLDGQMLMYNIKQSLTTTGPWTVVRSSNGATVANSDLWAAITNLLWSSGSHSWVILQNTNLGATFQVCIDLNSTNAVTLTIAYCQGGYNLATGTISARPSATISGDEVPLISTNAWGLVNSDVPCVWHAMYSTDGQCTRVVICQGNAPTGFWLFDYPQSPVTGWTNPHAMFAVGSSSSANIITHANTYQNPFVSTRFINGLGTVSAGHYMASEGFSASSAGNLQVAPNDTTGNYPLLPISLWSVIVGARGRNAQLFDLWFGEGTNSTGQSYPSSGTLYQFVQFGVLVLPWLNSTPPVIA